MDDRTVDLRTGARPQTEPPPSAPQRGDTVGRYLVVDVLGMGGMGVVYKAFDPVLNRAIALKVLLLGEARDEDSQRSVEQGRSRALREAQALAQLTHPNVVTVYDVGTHGEAVFLAMELVDGVTLSSHLKAQPRTPAEILALLSAAGQGLAAAHDQGIIHRDFKPNNVLVGSDGRVRVIDFGLARGAGGDVDATRPQASAPSTSASATATPVPSNPLVTPSVTPSAPLLASDVTQQGLVLGTPMYMAPEQRRGGSLDATADQFSFSVVLFEALYGQRPFAGETVEEVADNAAQHRVLRPPGARVPAWLDAIVTRGLAPDPKARFTSMHALLAALADDPEQRRARARERSLRRLGVGLALVVVSGSLGLAWRSQRQAASICRGAEGKLAGIWDGTTRQAIARAFAASRKSFAARALASVESTLDRYAQAWAGMYTEACEASSVRHEQSAEIMTLRMSCLQHRLGELRAATQLLQTVDTSVVEKATEISERLSSIAGCGDVEALTAPLPPPRDPATRAKVEALRDALARAKVLEDAAKLADGLAIVDPAAVQAAATGYRAIEAEAQYHRGRLLNGLGRYEDAATAQRSAFLAALASRHAEVQFSAALELLSIHNMGLSKPDEAERWGEVAHAVLAGMPDNRQAEARWLNTMGTLYWTKGELDKADDHIRRALAIREKLTGPGAVRATAASLVDLGVVADERGAYDEARRYYARAIELLESTVGPDHPALATVISNLGILAWEHGDYAAAEAQYLRALKIDTDAFGASHPNAALTILNLGLAYHDAGREAEALDHFQRSLALLEKSMGPSHTMLTWALQGIGRIAARRHDLATARAALERTIALCTGGKCDGEEKYALAEAEFALAQLLAPARTPALATDKRARALALDAETRLQKVKSVVAKRRHDEVLAWLGDHGGKPAAK